MNIAFGHENMDMDCLGSLILVKRLFPDYRLVKSNIINPAAWRLYNIYQKHFNFLTPEDLKNETIENIIIVDTCIANRVKEYFKHIKNLEPKIHIFDHHNLENCDIPKAEVEGAAVGATVTYLGKMAIKQNIKLLPEEATIALTGLYADTGRLIYENVRREDYEVSMYLLDMGAELKLVKSFLDRIIETDQILSLNQLLLVTEKIVVQRHSILVSKLTLEKNINGLNIVVEKVMDVENYDAYFAFFHIPRTKTILLIARSRKAKIDLHEIFHHYGGGGHQSAASLTITNRDFNDFYKEFIAYLETSLKPATLARDIMSKEVRSVNENIKLLEASVFLEDMDLSGVPVVNNQGKVVGFLGLKEIMKGRRASQMDAPVKAYMNREVIHSNSSMTIRQVEDFFYKHHINSIPIIENEELVGILTHENYLQYTRQRQ